MSVDPRGLRFAAALTATMLALVLVTGSGLLLLAQTAVFAVAALIGLHASPYAVLYRRAVRPRVGPPAELEDARPPRFAQAVGFAFGLIGLFGFAAGLDALAIGATAAAFVAAFLNAAFGFCLGCELYLLGRRIVSTPSHARI